MPNKPAQDIYLPSRITASAGSTSRSPSATRDTRYGFEVVNLRDENTGSSEKPVQLARKKHAILVEGESREGCTYLRLARIKRTAAGTLQQRPSFIPPLLDIAASEYLIGINGGGSQRSFQRRAAFSPEARRQRSASLADSPRGYRQLLAPLHGQQSSPRLRHFYETGKAHPEKLYRVLSALGGSLSRFP